MKAPDPARRAQAVVWIALGAAVASRTMKVWPNTWAPLADYPDQSAPSAVSGTRDKPPVLTVTARKCATESVDVFGSVTWVRIEPPGHLIAGPEGQATRVEGCTDFTYRNPVPPAVWADVCDHGPSTWVITGAETPFRAGGTGEVKRWQTTPIRMVCEPEPGK